MESLVCSVKLFLCGDVMIGRGIDQILPYSCSPRIYEPYMKDARGYVQLAEEKNGLIQTPVDFAYIWGDAIVEFHRLKPDVKIINLETAITLSSDWVRKGINYRMHPKNIPCLLETKIDFCSLANNHILDWGVEGLIETLETLSAAGIQYAGAGRKQSEASSPAIIPTPSQGRVVVFSFGVESSGVPLEWAVTQDDAGVNFIPDFSSNTIQRIQDRIQTVKASGDIIIVSIHWGSNWGYEILKEEIEFAHQLIDKAGIDLIHGHSSHHPKAIEVYHKKLILYGCGDFINDYEGISGYEEFRGDLGLMYFASVTPGTCNLISLELVPTQMKKLQVKRASLEDSKWIREILNREGKDLGTQFDLSEQGHALIMRWNAAG